MIQTFPLALNTGITEEDPLYLIKQTSLLLFVLMVWEGWQAVSLQSNWFHLWVCLLLCLYKWDQFCHTLRTTFQIIQKPGFRARKHHRWGGSPCLTRPSELKAINIFSHLFIYKQMTEYSIQIETFFQWCNNMESSVKEANTIF